MNKDPWYSVKCIFHHLDLKRRNGKNNYEERLILVRAEDFDDAINKAEKEAREYCKDLGPEVKYLNYCDAYNLTETVIGDQSELYSLITTSELNEEQYLDSHYNSGDEIAL